MFYRKLTYPAVIFSVIKPMVLKKSELTLPSKMQNTPFRQGKTILTRGIVIIGCIRNVIWSSVFSIKSKLFAELLLVMISLLRLFLLSYTLLPFGFCLNDTTLLSFQIRSSIIVSNYKNNPDINTAAAATRATTISGISNRASITAAAVPMTA